MRFFQQCIYILSVALSCLTLMALAACGGGNTSEFDLPTQPASGFESDAPHFFAMNGLTPFHEKFSGNPEMEAAVWDTLRKRLALMKELGVEYVRADMWWSSIEPAPGQWEWEFPDRIMEEIVAAGLKPMPVFAYNAAWDPDNSPATAERREQFGEYVYQIVSRYKDKTDLYEIWNEPNITPFWVPEPNAENYTALAKVAYTRAKEADPNCRVAAVCMANPEWSFLETCYQNGIADYMDILSHHMYNSNPDEAIQEHEVHRLRQIMAEYGDRNKPVIITEFGISSGPNHIIRVNTEQEQAPMIVKRHLIFRKMGIDMAFHFKLQDDKPEPPPDGYWGLVGDDSRKKPSWYAYEAMVRNLGGARYIGNVDMLPAEEAEQADAIEFQVYQREDGEYLAVAWVRNDDGTGSLNISIPTGLNTYVENMNGTRIGSAERNAAETITVSLNGNPTYIRDLPERFIPMAATRFDPEVLYLKAGETVETELLVKNPSVFPLEVDLTPLREELKTRGLSLQTETEAVRVLPGESVQHPIRISAAIDGADAGTWSFRHRDGYTYSYALTAVVENPIKVTVVGYKGEGGQAMWEAVVTNDSATPYAGRVAWEQPPGNEKGSEAVSLNPGETATFQGPVEQLGIGEGLILVRAIGDDGPEATGVLRLVGQPKAQMLPVIDGDLDDWPSVRGISILPPRQQIRPEPEARKLASKDCSASIRVQWSDDAVYIAADVVDASPMIVPDPIGDMWRSDSLEVYFGFAGPTKATAYQAGDFQVGLTPGNDGENPGIWNWKSLPGKHAPGENGNVRGAEIASQATEQGWIVEAKIPLSEFGDVDPFTGPIGFDVKVNNKTHPRDQGPEEKLVWNGDDFLWRDPSHRGIAFPQ